MLKKLNNFILSSIVVSILFALVGLGMMIFPDISLNVIAYTIAIIFIILGVYLFILDRRSLFMIDMMFTGILMIILGIIIMIYPKSFSLLIPIVLGIWIIADSLFKIRLSISLKDYDDTPWVLLLILSIVSLICGIIFIIHPLASSSIITMLFGSLIIVYAISDIVDMVMFKKYVDKIVKTFKKKLDKIEV